MLPESLNRENDENIENRENRLSSEHFVEKVETPQVTVRATLAGLLIGSVVLISNFQFGLQTGWVSMMSLPSALLGYAIFKLSWWGNDFTDVENVYVQSIAVASGTGPLAYGLIGIIPAIEKFLTEDESGLGRKIAFSLNDLLIWSFGLAFFGVFFAVPLRKQVIVKEKLPFPSGSATATLISVLYDSKIRDDDNSEYSKNDNTVEPVHTPDEERRLKDQKGLISNLRTMRITFLASAGYTVVSYFFPILKALPVFGTTLSKVYMWNVQPSPAYIGQGIIMGLPTVSYMLVGAILGWGIFAPLSKYQGWAPGKIDDWINGGQGWILWLSLSVMISDSLVSFAVVVFRAFRDLYSSIRARKADVEAQRLLDEEPTTLCPPDPDTPADHLVSFKTTIIGLVLSSVLCIISIRAVFGVLVPYYAIIIGIILALFFSVLGVRALGETDLNPVSGIGKLSQLIFAAVIPANHPSRVLINIIAGGIAEAGAQQAGDMMQDLKTGYLLGASPKALFKGQMIGTIYSVFLSSVMYKVYNVVYEIPSNNFRIPTAIVWVDCSRLVTGEGLPPKSFAVSLVFGIVFGAISLIKNITPHHHKWHKYLIYIPNGVPVGIGIYNSPNFTLARFFGGLLAYIWLKQNFKKGRNSKVGMVIFSSGLVLGEGLLSCFTMLLTSLGVKHF